MKSLTVILFIVLFTNCEEPPIYKPDETSLPELKVVWRAPLVSTEQQWTTSIPPVLHDSVVLFSSEVFVSGHHASVMFFDTATGEVVDGWNDYLRDPFISPETVRNVGDFLILGDNEAVSILNMATRTTHWKSGTGLSSTMIYTDGIDVYRGIYWGASAYSKHAAIIRSPISHREWDTVYYYIRNEKRSPNFNCIGFGELRNGDQVMIWKNRASEFGGLEPRTDIFGYNLTQDEIMWINQDFWERSGIAPIQIYKGVAYSILQTLAIAIDVETGQTLWTQQFDNVPGWGVGGIGDGAFVIHNDIMFIKGSKKSLIAVDRHTGRYMWHQPHPVSLIDDRFTVFEDKLFYISNELVICDVETGELLIQPEQYEHLGFSLRGPVTIDPERRVMYFTNHQEALCVKIPENI